MKSPSEADWEDFYRDYCGVILAYARKLGLSEQAAQDVLQETMVTLMRLLPAFEYDPHIGKFRNFVLTITHRRVQAALRRARRHETVSLDDGSDPEQPPLGETLVDDRAAADPDGFDRAWHQSLFEEAVRRLFNDPALSAQTLEVFRAYVLENHSADTVAARFGIAKNNVFQIKNRLVKRLQAEVALMTGDGAEPTPEINHFWQLAA
jgi:RNA polymerase sigma-70 factor (ECF subfamily)